MEREAQQFYAAAEARSAALAKFLQTHHSDDAQTRAAIVEYLVGLSMQ